MLWFLGTGCTRKAHWLKRIPVKRLTGSAWKTPGTSGAWPILVEARALFWLWRGATSRVCEISKTCLLELVRLMMQDSPQTLQTVLTHCGSATISRQGTVRDSAVSPHKLLVGFSEFESRKNLKTNGLGETTLRLNLNKRYFDMPAASRHWLLPFLYSSRDKISNINIFLANPQLSVFNLDINRNVGRVDRSDRKDRGTKRNKEWDSPSSCCSVAHIFVNY